MDDKLKVAKVLRVIGLGETVQGRAVVFEREDGERIGVIAERAIWFECSGLCHPDHAEDHTSALQLPEGQQVAGSEVGKSPSDEKFVVDLSLGSGEHLEVSMIPRAAQRLRDQLNGLLIHHKAKTQH